ncbi:MAG: DUF3987 domain-containing protein [Melioribacteraceae bacterium]
MSKSENILDNKNIEIKELNSDKKNEIKFDWTKLNETNFKKMLRYFDSISIAPVEYLLTSLLASMGGAVGKNVYFKITDSMSVYLNVWAVIIGRSTIMRKTTAMNLVCKDLQRIDTLHYNEYRKKLDETNRAIESAKANKEKLSIEKPVRDYIMFPNDSTVEALAENLSVSQRGLLTHSEFGAFLSQLSRGYSADAKQFLTNLYDVPSSYEISRTTKENTLLTRPCLSILGASTIDWIKSNSDETDLRSGFLSRFIYSIRNVPDKEYIPLFKLKSITQQSEFYLNTRDVYDYLVSFNEPTELDIEVKAMDKYNKYDAESFNELVYFTENDNELSFKGRLLIYTTKFAGLIALSEKRTVVLEQDIEDAMLITDYYKRNVERLLNTELAETEFTRKERRVIDFIKKRNRAVKRSELLTGLKIKAKELDELLTNLFQKDLLKKNESEHSYNKSKVTTYSLK